MASPLYRLLSDHFDSFRGRYEDEFERRQGRWRWVVNAVVARYLECGVLEAGFARVRCDACKAEYLLGFSCKTRYFCSSCHAKRLAEWTLWLGDELLAPVPHRQMVFTVPKRLRPYFLWRRKLLGDLARVAARTATTFVRTTLDEPELSVGIALSIQTHGSLLTWQPHTHALVTDSGFRPDGTFVRLPADSTKVLTEAFRRGMLKLFVERELFEPEVAEGMLEWMHSGFSVHDGVWLDEDDAAAHERLARYCARWVASEDFSRGEAKRRWAELIRLVHEVDPLKCPRCGAEMRVIALIQEPAVIDKIVKHLRDKGRDERAHAWATGPPEAGASTEAA